MLGVFQDEFSLKTACFQGRTVKIYQNQAAHFLESCSGFTGFHNEIGRG